MIIILFNNKKTIIANKNDMIKLAKQRNAASDKITKKQMKDITIKDIQLAYEVINPTKQFVTEGAVTLKSGKESN